MILDINNEECKNEIMLWAKTKGLLLAKTHQMPTFSNAFVIRNNFMRHFLYHGMKCNFFKKVK